MTLNSSTPLLALAAAGALLCLFGSASRAENDRNSATQFFVNENNRLTQPAPAAVRAPVHHVVPTFRRVLMQSATIDRRTRPALAPAPAAPPIVVAVYGDRLAQALASGLQDNDGSAVTISGSTGEDAGLSRPDFSTWLQGLRERVTKTDHPAVAVVMIGSADRQSLADGTRVAEPGTPRWQEIYGSRVDGVAAVFRDARVPLIWVGLPPVRSEEASADYVRLNGIVRDRATKNGATYIDSWEAFSDDAGRYSVTGPNIEGQTVTLRRIDGMGFTRAGARKLASFIEADIKRWRAPNAAAQPEVASIAIEKNHDFDSALEVDVNAQIRREAGLSPEAAVSPARLEGAPDRPAAGPVIPLTNPPLAQDGQLASASRVGPAGALQASLAIKPLGDAPPAAPRRGRADDFKWPRP